LLYNRNKNLSWIVSITEWDLMYFLTTTVCFALFYFQQNSNHYFESPSSFRPATNFIASVNFLLTTNNCLAFLCFEK